MLATWLLSPEGDVAAKERIVGADAFAKDRALIVKVAPNPHPNAIALLLGAAFQASISSILKCTVLELCKVDDCLLVSVIGCFWERIFVTSVEAIVFLAVPHL